jgi:hypothetical protein
MTTIDHPEQVERLMERLGAALPIPARLTPEVQMTLRQQRGVTMPTDCSVTWISYAGDEGGIVCRLEAQAETAGAVFASITHLRFRGIREAHAACIAESEPSRFLCAKGGMPVDRCS